MCLFNVRITAALAACAALAAQTPKQYKDAGEYPMFDAAIKDLAAGNGSKAIAGLDAWNQKYPASDFADDRQLLYVQAYAAVGRPAKALETAAPLLDQSHGAADTVKLLYTVAVAIQQLADPTAAELASGAKAARMLAAWEQMPEGMTAAAWAQTKIQLQAAAQAALLYTALVPGAQALKKNDCRAAETALLKALQDHPVSAQAAAFLGQAELCLYKLQPDKEKAWAAIYELARAATLDQSMQAALESVYRQYHGEDPEGLKQLKDLARKSPLPPSGFSVKAASEIAQEKQADFEKNNPELALWIRLKESLAARGGEGYFASEMKGAAMPPLAGVLIEARPECRPRLLLVAVRLPDSPQPLQPEITLKLDQPLTGKPELNRQLRWEGVGADFSASPFMLTMQTETSKIDGLQISACAPARRKQ